MNEGWFRGRGAMIGETMMKYSGSRTMRVSAIGIFLRNLPKNVVDLFKYIIIYKHKFINIFIICLFASSTGQFYSFVLINHKLCYFRQIKLFQIMEDVLFSYKRRLQWLHLFLWSRPRRKVTYVVILKMVALLALESKLTWFPSFACKFMGLRAASANRFDSCLFLLDHVWSLFRFFTPKEISTKPSGLY